MKKHLLLSAMMLASVFLTGCFGLAVNHPREKTTTQICLGSRGNLTNGPATAVPLTEARVLELWGRPDSIRTNREALTIWRYQGDRNWSFLVPAYLIPVPIPVASGHNHVDLYFKDGIARRAQGTVQVMTGAIIGYGAGVLAFEKEQTGDADDTLGCGFNKEPAEAAPPPAPPTAVTNHTGCLRGQQN